jgi:hypothetical protein
MRIVLIFFLASFVVLGGCARKPEVTYVELPPDAPPVSATEGGVTLAATMLNTWGRQRTDPESGWSALVGSNARGDTDMDFELAQAKAERIGVENLTEDDIEGLSFDRIQELRGY